MKKALFWAIVVSVILVIGGIVWTIQSSKRVNSDVGHFASQEEILGYWELVQWTPEAKAKNKQNPWTLPYQYFAIYNDGVMTYHMASSPTNDTPQSLDEVRKLFSNINYTFSKGMMVVTRKDLPNYREIWGVNIITKKFTGSGVTFLPGDMIMSLDDGKGNVIYYRHLRKIQ